MRKAVLLPALLLFFLLPQTAIIAQVGKSKKEVISEYAITTNNIDSGWVKVDSNGVKYMFWAVNECGFEYEYYFNAQHMCVEYREILPSVMYEVTVVQYMNDSTHGCVQVDSSGYRWKQPLYLSNMKPDPHRCVVWELKEEADETLVLIGRIEGI